MQSSDLIKRSVFRTFPEIMTENDHFFSKIQHKSIITFQNLFAFNAHFDTFPMMFSKS